MVAPPSPPLEGAGAEQLPCLLVATRARQCRSWGMLLSRLLALGVLARNWVFVSRPPPRFAESRPPPRFAECSPAGFRGRCAWHLPAPAERARECVCVCVRESKSEMEREQEKARER